MSASSIVVYYCYFLLVDMLVSYSAAATVQDYNDPEVDAADDEGLDAGDDRKDAKDKPDVLQTNISAKQFGCRSESCRFPHHRWRHSAHCVD